MERMTIGDFAREARLTPKALRLYDDMGLLVPAEVDPGSGYRYYRADQLERARLVAGLRLIGMPLARIRLVADLPAAAGAAELASYWRQVEADVRTRRTRVRDLVDEMRSKEHHMSTTTRRAEVAWRSEQGAREEQLDALHAGRELWAVADGTGHNGTTARTVIEALANADLVGHPAQALDAAVARAGAAVEERAEGERHSSTLTALWLLPEQVAIAHVGDSRAWLWRDDEMALLTRDHTVVQSLLDEGALTEEEARSDPRRNLLNRAIVQGIVAEADVFLVPVQTGDRFVLTTDGVHAVLPPEALVDLLGRGTPQESVDAVAGAVEAAGAPDNYAVIVADVA